MKEWVISSIKREKVIMTLGRCLTISTWTTEFISVGGVFQLQWMDDRYASPVHHIDVFIIGNLMLKLPAVSS